MATQTLQPGCAPANAPTRRTILCGALAAPALAAVPALALTATSPAVWDAAIAAYWRAVEVTEEYDQRHYAPALERYMKVRDRWPVNHRFDLDPASKQAIAPAMAAVVPYEEQHTENVGDQMKACYALAAIAAPDMAALGMKAAIMAYEYDSCESPHAITRSILADARRLATGASAWPMATCEMRVAPALADPQRQAGAF